MFGWPVRERGTLVWDGCCVSLWLFIAVFCLVSFKNPQLAFLRVILLSSPLLILPDKKEFTGRQTLLSTGLWKATGKPESGF